VSHIIHCHRLINCSSC